MYRMVLLLSFVSCYAQQQIPTHDPQYNFQLIQPHEVASNYQLLKLTDEILCKNQISYWVWGGTLIGAVRHQGFIPWDFDTDICLFEEDLERFLACSAGFKKYDAYILHRGCDPFGRNIYYRIKRIKNGEEVFGHVDVAIMEKINDQVIHIPDYKHFFIDSEVSKFIRLPFGPIRINAPADFMPYLIRGYGEDVMEVAEIMYTINPATGLEYPKFKITQFQPAIYEVIDPSIPLDNTLLFP